MTRTQTDLARQYMTPQTSSLFKDATLSRRLGQGTVAGGLNDQIRFRFDRKGAPSAWKLVPDNKVSADLLASPAGPGVESKVQALLRPLDAEHAAGRLHLNGIMLAENEQSWAAGYQLMQRDHVRTTGRDMAIMKPAESAANAEVTANIAGAQALYGWVQVAPDYARNMLTSVGAYTPAKDERAARAGRMAQIMGPVLGHELQHRVSEAPLEKGKDFVAYSPVAWLEEGTATVLAEEGKAGDRNRAAWGVSNAQHAGQVGAPDHFNPQWGPWKRDLRYMAGFADTGQKNYVDSIGTIYGLMGLAGVDRRTSAGQEQMTSLLQRQGNATQVPERVARAILKEHGVRATDKRVAELSQRVVESNTKGGLARVRGYVEDLTKS